MTVLIDRREDSEVDASIPKDTKLADVYVFDRKIGSGSFGEIYRAKDVSQLELPDVAIKLEKADSPHKLLKFEHSVYSKMQLSVGIPRVMWFGSNALRVMTSEEDYVYDAMVMELMGSSLESLFRKCKRKFSLKTVLMLTEQMLTRLEVLHSKGYIHRDIKPENFLIGLGENAPVVYIIDFGLAKKYLRKKGCDSRGTHIPYRENQKLTGTPRYASVNTHVGIEQSRRDDLESLGYVLMYFLRGRLPWQGIDASTKAEKYEIIESIKRTTSIDTLCHGYPEEFAEYFRYCRLLYFEDKPDYSQLRRMFRRLFFRCSFQWDYEYDWDTL